MVELRAIEQNQELRPGDLYVATVWHRIFPSQRDSKCRAGVLLCTEDQSLPLVIKYESPAAINCAPCAGAKVVLRARTSLRAWRALVSKMVGLARVGVGHGDHRFITPRQPCRAWVETTYHL